MTTAEVAEPPPQPEPAGPAAPPGPAPAGEAAEPAPREEEEETPAGMPKASPGLEGGTKAQPQAGAAASPPPAPAPPPAEAPGEEGSPTGIAIPNGIAFRLDALHPPPVRPPHPRDLTRGEGGGGGQGPRPRQLGHGWLPPGPVPPPRSSL